MDQAKTGDTVKIQYTGKLEDGSVFDSSKDRDALEFKIGEGRIIRGLEQAVIGMAPGDSKSVEISGDEAFGPHRKELVIPVQRDKIPSDIEPAVGQRLQIQKTNGQIVDVTVADVSDSHVTLDANHPLVGRNLQFDIQLLEIK